jgi:hypothetical protein
MKRLLTLLPVLLLLLGASRAEARNIMGFDLKLGLRAGPNFSVLREPKDIGSYQTVPYPSMYYGLGWSGGLTLNARVIDLLGVEVGALLSFDEMEGHTELNVTDSENNREKVKFNQFLSQRSLHLPVVAQLHLPIGLARPFASAGIDLVVSRSSRTYSQDFGSFAVPEANSNSPDRAEWYRSALAQAAAGADINDADTAIYGGLIGGIGVNIVAPKIEIPIELRVAYYPTVGTETTQRFADPLANGIRTCSEDSVFVTETTCAALPTGATPAKLLYNDAPQFQFVVLFGFDYMLL